MIFMDDLAKRHANRVQLTSDGHKAYLEAVEGAFGADMLTNAFSKKAANHAHMMAIYFMHYNFVRIHQTLKVTPAMASGVTSKLWEMSDMVKVLENWEVAH
jgi:hypothetical protein